jgi:hypothetical protein
MPLEVGRTNISDPVKRDANMEDILENVGSASWGGHT